VTIIIQNWMHLLCKKQVGYFTVLIRMVTTTSFCRVIDGMLTESIGHVHVTNMSFL
jgi:hypothetical protein